MRNIKRIFNNFQNNKVSYIMLGIFIIIMNICIFTSLKIENYNFGIIEDIRTQYGSYVTIEKDPRFLSDDNNLENLTYEDYEKIGTSEYVDETYYEQTLYVRVENIVSNEEQKWFENQIGLFDYLTIIGSNNLDDDYDFLFNNAELTSGHYPKKDNEIIVSTDFATKNNIKLNQYKTISYNDSIVRFRVVGIYDFNSEAELKTNTIYTTYNTTQLLSGSKENIQAMYHLKSYKDVNLFEKELYDAGLSQLYYVNNNQIIVEQEINPYKKNINLVDNMRNTVFIIFLILILIMSTFIFKGKKDTIVIFRMLGVSKFKLLFVTFLEFTVIVIFSLIISYICISIIDILFLQAYTLPILYYLFIVRDMFLANLVILVLINLETLLFINGYNVNEIVMQNI